MLGLLLHLILIVAAALFYAARRRLPWAGRHAVSSGLLYGVCIYAFMTLVVVPLSAFPYKTTFDPPLVALNLVAHMVLVGLVISLFAHASTQHERDGVTLAT